MAGPLSVMMPVYNEDRTLPTILERVLRRPEVGELIAVDDGSSDRTWEILSGFAAADHRVRTFRHARNRGKGAAIRSAVGEVRRPIALVQDADLELDPDDYPAMLRAFGPGIDAVYGVRDLKGRFRRNPVLVIGNWGVTWSCNLMFGSRLHDILTGYKVMRSAIWKDLDLVSDRFEIDPEITARLLRLGVRIHEVPVAYHPRTKAEGKKVGVGDGLEALRALLRVRLRSYHQLFEGLPQPNAR